MNNAILISTGVALAVALAACDRADAPAQGNTPAAASASAADTDAVKKLETDFLAAIETKDFATAKAAYAADAVMVLPGDAPYQGAAAIAAEYDDFAADPAGKFDANNQSTVVSTDMAYSQGTYTVSYTSDETKKVETGQGYYVTVYKKQPDGSWKIVQDVSSPLPRAS
jgi:uncharacterized protein (TIGR02246 family)